MRVGWVRCVTALNFSIQCILQFNDVHALVFCDFSEFDVARIEISLKTFKRCASTFGSMNATTPNRCPLRQSLPRSRLLVLPLT